MDSKSNDSSLQKTSGKERWGDGEKNADSGIGAGVISKEDVGGKGEGKGEMNEVDEMKARKIAAIETRIAALESELTTAKEKLSLETTKLKNPAQTTVKQHIHLLHEYNEIRDIGQGLIGMIAENRGVRISDAYEEFGVSLGD